MIAGGGVGGGRVGRDAAVSGVDPDEIVVGPSSFDGGAGFNRAGEDHFVQEFVTESVFEAVSSAVPPRLSGGRRAAGVVSAQRLPREWRVFSALLAEDDPPPSRARLCPWGTGGSITFNPRSDAPLHGPRRGAKNRPGRPSGNPCGALAEALQDTTVNQADGSCSPSLTGSSDGLMGKVRSLISS